MKAIIWGHPLHSHTHSYAHYGFYRAFENLGYDVYWFHDNDYPQDFDFENCVFISEGFADKNIPINDSSTYFVMYVPDPSKYQNAKNFFDLRLNAVNFKDHVLDFSFDQNKCTNIGPSFWLEPKKNELIKFKNDYVDYEIPDYNKVYFSWATYLLPEEINFDDMYLEREKLIYFSGTISADGVCENYSNWEPFLMECRKNEVPFLYNNVWQQALPFEEVKLRVQKSLLGIDIRGPQHVKWKIATCRVFENISYGHLGLTNSKVFYEELDGNCIYNSDTAQLFYDGLNNSNNYNLIKSGMQYVKENHTFINRVKSIMSLV